MKKNIFKLLLIPFLFLTSCGTNYDTVALHINANDCVDSIGSLVDDDIKNNVVYETTLKIVYEVEYSISCENSSEVIASIGDKNSELGGYFGDSSQTEYRTRIIYRVPTDKLNEFLDFIDTKDGISSKEVSTTDVTSSYSTLEAKISVLTASRKAYVKMIEKEGITMADLIALQDKIDAIDEELLTYSNQKDKLDSKLSYSTVTICYYYNSVYEESSWFSDYFYTLGEFFVGVGKAILYVIPIGGFFAILGIAIYLPIMKASKKRKAKRKEEFENK